MQLWKCGVQILFTMLYSKKQPLQKKTIKYPKTAHCMQKKKLEEHKTNN